MQRAVNEPGPADNGRLRFGVFELDLRSGELRRHGSVVRIQPQPLKVLLLLASRPGQVVTRQQIQSEIWPAGTYVDFEQSLNFCVRQIRTALGDSAVSPRYVETLPKRGYRWVGGALERVRAESPAREWPRAVGGKTPEPAAPRPLPPATIVSASSLRPAGGRRRSFAGALAALSLLAFATVLWWATRPRPTAQPPTFQRLTLRQGLVRSARFSPTGEVVFSAAFDGQPPRLYLTRSDPRDASELERDGVVVGVSGSGEVALLRDGVLSRVPVAAGEPKQVLSGVIAADWAPQGGDFAVARRDGERVRIEYPIGRVLVAVLRPSRIRLSPDGRRIAVAEHPTFDDDRGTVAIYDRSGRRVAAAEGWASLDGLAWAPAGDEVWFTATRTGADNSLFALSLRGTVRPVLAGMGRLVLHDVAADGRVLLERATQRSELLFRGEREREQRDLSWFDLPTAAALSADGGQILFYESGEGGGPGYLTFLRRTDGSPPVRVGPGRACSLSPDGRWALTIDLARPEAVIRTPIGAGEVGEIRLPGVIAHEMAGFVGDGGTVFVIGRDGAARRAVWLAGADGTNPRRLAIAGSRIPLAPAFSPDGTRILTACAPDQPPCIQPIDGGSATPVRGARPGWLPVGWDERDRIYFRDRTRLVPERLWRVGLASGEAEPLGDLAPRDRAGLLAVTGVVVARDGRSWAYSVLRRLSDLHVVSGLR